MGADFKDLVKYGDDLKRLNDVEREAFIIATLKELTARLLAMVVKRTPALTGYLRRGWDINSNLSVKKSGNKYVVNIVNPVEYASYVEYGHRTKNHNGWVNGKFMLTISKQELEGALPSIVERKLKRFVEGVMK